MALLQASVSEFQLNGHAVDAGVVEDVPDLLMERFDPTERTVELGGDSHVQRGHVSTLCQLPQVGVVDTQDPGKTAHFLHYGKYAKRTSLRCFQKMHKSKNKDFMYL